MYTITECNIVPYNFDTLFDQCLPIMEAGTIDWRYLGNPSDNDAKKTKLRDEYEEFISLPNTKVIYWEKDGHPIHLAAGRINPDDEQYILWVYALYGSDANGSKGWLHDPAYITQTKEYIRDTLGLAGYKISCHQNSGLYDYHMSKVGSADNYEVTIDRTYQPDLATDVTVAVMKYRYLQ